MTARLMWDPPSATGGMLTERELAACVRVLRALSTTSCASVVLAWPAEDHRAYRTLCSMRYVAEVDPQPLPGKLSAPFRWARIRTTDEGRAWLAQVSV